jgi:hypothetical protein
MPFGRSSPESALAKNMIQMARDIRTIRHVAVAWFVLSIVGGALLAFGWLVGSVKHEAAVTTPYVDTLPAKSRDSR